MQMNGRFKALAFDVRCGKWLGFSDPHMTFTCSSAFEIPAVLDRIEQVTREQGLWSVGWVSYEAAAGVDGALETKPPGELPLAWFALYPAPTLLDSLPVSDDQGVHAEWTPSISQSEYDSALSHVRSCILRGDTYQVNFSMRLRSSDVVEPLQLFSSMVSNQRGPYSIFLDSPRFVVCSASPELFFERDDGVVVSRPMKGTCARGHDEASDARAAMRLRSSEKERAENSMIVDMVRNDLSRVAKPGSVVMTDLCKVETYPNVLQMTSEVQARSRARISQIFQALFPAASITGAPKSSTMKIIKELECSPRGIYTGAVGVIAPSGRTWFNVAIRTAVIDRAKQTIEYGTGSGVVWDSVSSTEYRECLAKASVILTRPDRSSLFETMLWEPSVAGIFLLDRHIARISRSAAFLGFPFDEQIARDKIATLQGGLGGMPQRIRMLLNRHGEISFEVSEVKQLDEPYTVSMAKSAISSTTVALYHKTTDRSVYESCEPEVSGCSDVILWNERGEITETRIANVVVELDGVLYTPPVSSGLLPGCYREELLAAGQIVERVLYREDIQRATRVFLCNSLRRQWEVQFVAQSGLEVPAKAATCHRAAC